MSEGVVEEAKQHVCEYCSGLTRAEQIRIVLWEGQRLVVIEDVPALVCEGCFEQYYDDAVRSSIDWLRGRGFPQERADRTIEASVFSYADIRNVES